MAKILLQRLGIVLRIVLQDLVGRQEQSTSGWLAMRSIWGCELHHIPVYISYKERALLTTWLWLRDNDSRAIAIPIGVVIGASIIRITC